MIIYELIPKVSLLYKVDVWLCRRKADCAAICASPKKMGLGSFKTFVGPRKLLNASHIRSAKFWGFEGPKMAISLSQFGDFCKFGKQFCEKKKTKKNCPRINYMSSDSIILFPVSPVENTIWKTDIYSKRRATGRYDDGARTLCYKKGILNFFNPLNNSCLSRVILS